MKREEILNLAEKIKECGIPGKLLIKGYVKLKDNTVSPNDYENLELTIKGKKLLGEKIENIDLIWINEYRDKFKKCNSEKAGDKSAVTIKMKDFIESYEYTKDQILQATDNYIAQLNGNYGKMEMANAEYFISYTDPVLKLKRSKLLTFCEQLNDIQENKWM